MNGMDIRTVKGVCVWRGIKEGKEKKREKKRKKRCFCVQKMNVVLFNKCNLSVFKRRMASTKAVTKCSRERNMKPITWIFDGITSHSWYPNIPSPSTQVNSSSWLYKNRIKRKSLWNHVYYLISAHLKIRKISLLTGNQTTGTGTLKSSIRNH